MTSEPIPASYSWGMKVVALDDLLNDGSYPERTEGERLVEAGMIGEIVNIGQMVDTGEPVYLVEFNACVIGCTEDEIAPAPAGLLMQPEASPK